MKEKNVADRLTFLAQKFDVFECHEDDDVQKKTGYLEFNGYKSTPITSNEGAVIAIVSNKTNEKERKLNKVSISSKVFTDMIIADPSENHIYLQWMLTTFSRLLKEGTLSSLELAIRFVSEDLPQANMYLTLFDINKRKKKFKELCSASYSLKAILDPTNIDQYKNLSQLFDAVDPFIEREPSAVERTLKKFVQNGQALIPVQDRKFTLYIPKTTAASVVFANFANWCTATKGNGMFNSYTSGNLKPNGKKSDIYIIINNKFFTGESDEMYQIHFETNQLKDRKNAENVSIFENVLSESEGLLNYFHDELVEMAKGFKKGLDNNRYLDYLIQFGFADSLFELIDEKTPAIRINKREVPRLPDISKFKTLDQIVILEAKMVELHPSIGKLDKLRMLSLHGNKLKALPREIGSLKKLIFLNIVGNPIMDIPTDIKYLDKSNGGSLERIAVTKDDIGEKNYNLLRELLPTVIFNEIV
jgi:hypothetical protein